MPPTSHLAFTDSGLLCGYRGPSEDDHPIFTWTYSTFEKYLNECITPSMYHFMANYVLNEISIDELYDIQNGEYSAGDLEAEAVDAYYDEPLIERIRMHEQELVNLRAAKRRAEARESAAIDAMLTENKPFDHTSPIDREYSDFMRSIIENNRAGIDRLECEIHEEEQWRGGHEECASDLETDENYDPMAEPN